MYNNLVLYVTVSLCAFQCAVINNGNNVLNYLRQLLFDSFIHGLFIYCFILCLTTIPRVSAYFGTCCIYELLGSIK